MKNKMKNVAAEITRSILHNAADENDGEQIATGYLNLDIAEEIRNRGFTVDESNEWEKYVNLIILGYLMS